MSVAMLVMNTIVNDNSAEICYQRVTIIEGDKH